MNKNYTRDAQKFKLGPGKSELQRICNVDGENMQGDRMEMRRSAKYIKTDRRLSPLVSGDDLDDL